MNEFLNEIFGKINLSIRGKAEAHMSINSYYDIPAIQVQYQFGNRTSMFTTDIPTKWEEWEEMIIKAVNELEKNAIEESKGTR